MKIGRKEFEGLYILLALGDIINKSQSAKQLLIYIILKNHIWQEFEKKNQKLEELELSN